MDLAELEAIKARGGVVNVMTHHPWYARLVIHLAYHLYRFANSRATLKIISNEQAEAIIASGKGSVQWVKGNAFGDIYPGQAPTTSKHNLN